MVLNSLNDGNPAWKLPVGGRTRGDSIPSNISRGEHFRLSGARCDRMHFGRDPVTFILVSRMLEVI